MILAEKRGRALALAAGLLLWPAAQAAAQTEVKPGFNIFSVEQDVEIGRRAAAEAERQLPIMSNRRAERLLDGIVGELAAVAPGARFPYQARLVNAADINAFALPGGFLYVNRGLVEAARNEGELAGVIAHEMAHIALRHGTHQASKASAAQAGLGILGTILGRQPSTAAQIVGSLGLNAVFLKFSRDDERDADIVGAQMMARAGYDPEDMATFFDLLRDHQRRDPGKVELFFSSHPSPANRASRIRQEASLLGARGGPARGSGSSGDLSAVQYELRSMGAAPRQRRDLGRADRGRPQETIRTRRVSPPSGRYATYEHRDGFFSMSVPAEWNAQETDNGVTLAPSGGIVQGRDTEVVVYGAIVNVFQPTSGRRGRVDLDDATQELIERLVQGNPHLRASGVMQGTRMEGAPARAVSLRGRSAVTGLGERVQVTTRLLADGEVLYAVFVAPEQDWRRFAPAFDRMAGTMRVDDDRAYR